MHLARSLIVAGLALVAALPGGGQEKSPLRYQELLYPLGVGYRWHYRVTDKNAPKSPDDAKKSQMVLVTVEREQTFSLKLKNDEASTQVVGFELQVQNLKAGDKKVMQEQVLIAEDGVYRVSGAGKAISPPLRILKKDARKGQAWTVASQSENAEIKGALVATEETVEVPAGKFATVAVRSQDFHVGAQKMQVTAWYAPNVGMVKQHIQVGNHDLTLELEKFEKGK